MKLTGFVLAFTLTACFTDPAAPDPTGDDGSADPGISTPNGRAPTPVTDEPSGPTGCTTRSKNGCP